MLVAGKVHLSSSLEHQVSAIVMVRRRKQWCVWLQEVHQHARYHGVAQCGLDRLRDVLQGASSSLHKVEQWSWHVCCRRMPSPAAEVPASCGRLKLQQSLLFKLGI